MGTCFCNNNKTNKQKCCLQKVCNKEQAIDRERERERGEERYACERENCCKSFKHHQNALRPNLNVFELLLRPVLIIFTYTNGGKLFLFLSGKVFSFGFGRQMLARL